MSLRIFHVVFIVVSIVLSIFASAWGVWRFSAAGSVSGLVMGVLFLACGAALVLYAMKAFHKLRELV